jgi:AraC family transcriptional regulator
LAKIAADLDRALKQRAVHGTAGRMTGRRLAGGAGWSVEDMICTSGPSDRPFEEQHAQVSIAIVAAGSFQYRSTAGTALMTPGSLMLGYAGQYFECGHEHGTGDRCISFKFAPEYFERVVIDAGGSPEALNVRPPRLPPIQASASVVAQACAGLMGSADVSWEEIALRIAACVGRAVSHPATAPAEAPPSAAARVTRVVRAIERSPVGRLTLSGLAAQAGSSPYHFLRTFERLTGLTPHQYVRRSRLREAAMRLALEPTKVIDIAFETGFGDVSNFNRAFRAEFGVSPRVYRKRAS